MSATPAQVANDLNAQSNHFDRSEPELAQACRDAARAIRGMLDEGKIDGRTYVGVHRRMLNFEMSPLGRTGSQIAKSISRGRMTLEQLHGALVKGVTT